MTYPTRTEVEARLDSARMVFLKKDRHLLEVKASERSITHKFAEALQQGFGGWDVDCEYNRVAFCSTDPKKLHVWAAANEGKTGRVFPDIIVHQRQRQGESKETRNAVALEGKRSTASKKSKKADREKLQAFRKELRYEHAVQLVFTVGHAPNISWEFVD